MDNERLGSRRKRGMIAVAFDAIWVTGTYIAQTAWLASLKFDRSVTGPGIGLSDSSYKGAVIIYVTIRLLPEYHNLADGGNDESTEEAGAYRRYLCGR